MLWRGRLTIAAGVSLLAAVCAQLVPSSPEAGLATVVAAVDAAATPQAATSPARETVPPPLVEPEGMPLPEVAAPLPAAGLLAAPVEVLGYLPVAHIRKQSLRGELAGAGAPLTQRVDLPGASPFQIEYTLDPALTDAVYSIFRRGRVRLGLALVLDAQGDVLAYVGTDEQRLPPDRAYPAASLVKVVTAAAAIEKGLAARPCRFTGSPYRLTPARIVPPRGGKSITLAQALATSNNQCFAQLAVVGLGAPALLEAIARFGLVSVPAPAHEAGRALDPGGDRYMLGKLGCGLAGLHITVLHAAELAAALGDGTLPEVRWIARVTDPSGRELVLPPRRPPRRVLEPAVARELREMMVETTVRGTARSAFRHHARALLATVRVAAKTGSLSGSHPPGRYEWFVAAAPAERPRVFLAVLVVQGKRWSTSGAQVGAQILSAIFCERGTCNARLADRFRVPPAPVLQSHRGDAVDTRVAAAPVGLPTQERCHSGCPGLRTRPKGTTASP